MSTPLHQQGVQGHDCHAQAVFNINANVSALEQKFAGVEARLSKLESKVDTIATDVTTGKATFHTLKWVLSICGGVSVALWGLITVFVGMMAKHYLGW